MVGLVKGLDTADADVSVDAAICKGRYPVAVDL